MLTWKNKYLLTLLLDFYYSLSVSVLCKWTIYNVFQQLTWRRVQQQFLFVSVILKARDKQRRITETSPQTCIHSMLKLNFQTRLSAHHYRVSRWILTLICIELELFNFHPFTHVAPHSLVLHRYFAGSVLQVQCTASPVHILHIGNDTAEVTLPTVCQAH